MKVSNLFRRLLSLVLLLAMVVGLIPGTLFPAKAVEADQEAAPSTKATAVQQDTADVICWQSSVICPMLRP